MESTGISQDRASPTHEVVQIAVSPNNICSRTKPQMKSIAQNNLRADIGDVARQHAFHRAIGPHGHKSRSLHSATGKRQLPSSCEAIAM